MEHSNHNSAPAPARLRARVLVIFAVAVGFVFGGLVPLTSTSAQYPPPTPKRSPRESQEPQRTPRARVCHTFRGDSRTPTTTFPQGSPFRMECNAGTLRSGEEAEIFVESDPVLLTTVVARADGSFSTGVVRLPLAVEPGLHTVRVVADSTEFTHPITVIGSDVGTLPRTGRDIALLIFWAVFFLVVGTLFTTTTWKRWREARAHANGLRTTSGVPRLSASDVGDLDVTTWHDPAKTDASPPAVEPSGGREETPKADRESSDLSAVVKRLQSEVENWKDSR